MWRLGCWSTLEFRRWWRRPIIWTRCVGRFIRTICPRLSCTSCSSVILRSIWHGLASRRRSRVRLPRRTFPRGIYSLSTIRSIGGWGRKLILTGRCALTTCSGRIASTRTAGSGSALRRSAPSCSG
uniref:(northern house mosquito) hypothetical protein n=1 Tax=Culex pipiens TaxID=7175 RepID=A0A8D8IFC7_CULPI